MVTRTERYDSSCWLMRVIYAKLGRGTKDRLVIRMVMAERTVITLENFYAFQPNSLYVMS